MGAPRKFDAETHARAVRMSEDRLAEREESKLEARRQVGALLDVNQAPIRNWVEAEEEAAGSRSVASPRQVESEEVRALKRRVAELEAGERDPQDRLGPFFAQAELDRRLK